MIDFFEVIKRALNGPYYSEQDFNIKLLVPKVREAVKKYGIRYDPETPVPDDDQLADNVFQAGLALCEEVGCYCKDTSRVIRFSREEILEALKDAPVNPVFGEGRETDPTLDPRTSEHGGSTPCEERCGNERGGAAASLGSGALTAESRTAVRRLRLESWAGPAAYPGRCWAGCERSQGRWTPPQNRWMCLLSMSPGGWEDQTSLQKTDRPGAKNLA